MISIAESYTPISHQLPPAPWEGCHLIPEECESGWEKVSPTDAFQEKPKPKGDQDILKYYRGNEVYPPWMRMLEPLKVPAAPKARVEKPAKTIARLSECMKRDDVKTNGSQCGERYIGAKIGDYTCVATDGRRALMQRDAPKVKGKAKKWSATIIPKRTDQHVILSDPEIMLALMRIAIVTKEDKQAYVLMEWDFETGELLLKAKSEGFEGAERCKCQATYTSSITLNPKFILEGMGCWPMMLYTYGDTAPAFFAPMPAKKNRNPDFYYIVMPIKL